MGEGQFDINIQLYALTPQKLALIQRAAETQLRPWEYSELLAVVEEFKKHGETPWVKEKLGQLLTRVHFGAELKESPGYEKALVACDQSFTLEALKRKCKTLGLSIGAKKEMCHKLYQAMDEAVVAVMSKHMAQQGRLPGAPQRPALPQRLSKWQKAQNEASERIAVIENEWVAKTHVGVTQEQQSRIDAVIEEVAKEYRVPASILRKAVLWEIAPNRLEVRGPMTETEIGEWLEAIVR